MSAHFPETPNPPEENGTVWSPILNEDPPPTGLRQKIPAPKTVDWMKSSRSWDEFCRAAHRSMGRNLGGGVLTFSEEP